MLRSLRSLISASTVVAVLSHAGSTWAHCRATTCDRSKQSCTVDEHGCVTNGSPLLWPRGEVAIGVDSAGSVLRGITSDDFQQSLTDALEAWVSARCPGGGHPSLRVKKPTLVEGAVAAYVKDGTNQNVVLFEDEHWPYGEREAGRAVLRFDPSSGDMLDADVLLNSEGFPLATDGTSDSVDLTAVLTHEIGHVFGLDHSDAPGATMRAETSEGFGAQDLRSLEPDDMEGICAIYPAGMKYPADTSEEAVISGDHGCAVNGRGRAPLALGSALIGLGLVMLTARRRLKRDVVGILLGERARKPGGTQ
jgi:Matrixin